MTDTTEARVARVSAKCPRCLGWGEVAYFGDAQVTCPECRGAGTRKHLENER